ncbi:TIGR03752 family integrating conjugative element protein [Haliea sp.]|jgi:integrating conjugative element protein (TIGR03752 family)|uniref:TIGR03752 family integrating conjugative element protein n=1 Tax=Haliea sp. TaxID=1932666 RepID=UPI000C36E963|nr:TIGR03752 family integrating conjugative element protein [Haliea sp.]MAD65385.1 TIGR03752 family integrating conjugative element protein [Haliea sp.]MAY93334.1 TIGR03752 family integrating conjugative element protein [Haliea sp.]|tara:strand:+ start:11020 stop:12429 length:1410 start_codon:yes stop_codon:yes gene_type:complete
MSHAVSNRLLPLLATLVLLVLLGVTLKTCSAEGENELLLTGVPTAPDPDADTPADTIKTLTANVAAMTTAVTALRQDNAALRRENQTLINNRSQIEENVATRLRRELRSLEQDKDNQARRDSGVLQSLTQRVDSLAASLNEVQSAQPDQAMPVGLGLEGWEGPGNSPADASALVWIAPLDAETDPAASGGLAGARQAASGYLGDARRLGGQLVTDTRERVEAQQDRPVYTVPRNATLMGSTVMTALVGRIPLRGQVQDPMPFKIITGADNLAANGLTVPGVQGMIWSGTAVGDWTLSCVSGRLESVTFVFDDGTIRTVASDDGQGQGGRDEPLGWISDAQGIPCISGTRKSNASAFLAQRIGVQAVQAAADAAAAAESTSVITSAGGITGGVTGDVGAYVLGKTIAGGSDELAQWLLERQSQSFDAVFVPAGIAVAIHVDRAIPIDFEPQGRKLSHASLSSSHAPHTLD